MDTQLLTIKKSTSLIYLLIFLLFLAVSILFIVLEFKNGELWLYIYYLAVALCLYHLYVYGVDFFTKDAGIKIDEHGLFINFEYYKKIMIPWGDIKNIGVDRSTILVFVHDPQKYLNKINKISALLIKGSLKRIGTIIYFKPAQFNIEKSQVVTHIKEAFEKHRSPAKKNEEA